MVPARCDRCYYSYKELWIHNEKLGLHPEIDGSKWKPISLRNLPGFMPGNNNIDSSLAGMESRKGRENTFWTSFSQWGLVPLITTCLLFPRGAKPHWSLDRDGVCRVSSWGCFSVTNTETGHPLTYAASSFSSSPTLLWFSVWPNSQSSFFAA